MRSLPFIHRILAIILLLTYLYFLGVCFAWVFMAGTDFWGWWSMFLKAGGWTVGMTFLCAIAGMVEHTRRVIAAPTRRASSRNGDVIRIDVKLAAAQLAEKARASARKNNSTDQDAAQLLISQYEAQKYDFLDSERIIMRDIVMRAVDILQRGR